MSKRLVRYGTIIAAAVGLAAALAGVSFERAAESTIGKAAPTKHVEAANLRIYGADWRGEVAPLLDASHPVWKTAKPVSLLLNRAPRLYPADKVGKGPTPEAAVQYARASNGIAVRLTWQDATKDQPDVRKASPAGPEAGVRVAHSQSTNRFYDAAAVMVPEKADPKVYPCIQMGEKLAPVNIYYWHAVKGRAAVRASGRGTTERAGKILPAKAVHSDGKWQVVFTLPALPKGSPIALAVWNGAESQSGGLKYYSVWHTLR